MEELESKDKNFCQCGCGTEIELFNCRKQRKRFAKGHNVVNFVKHGSEHPSWKGGRTTDGYGYTLIWCPNHPRAQRGYVGEHILVMERHIGRYLKRNEIPHHKNENKADNRIENLSLLTERKHKRYHTIKMWVDGKYDKRVQKQREKQALGYSVQSIIYWKRRWNWLYYGSSIGINQFTKFV